MKTSVTDLEYVHSLAGDGVVSACGSVQGLQSAGPCRSQLEPDPHGAHQSGWGTATAPLEPHWRQALVVAANRIIDKPGQVRGRPRHVDAIGVYDCSGSVERLCCMARARS